MIEMNWWQSLLTFVAFLSVVGWANAMHDQAKRTADLLEELVMDLRVRQSGR